jgi:hypothetical protein
VTPAKNRRRNLLRTAVGLCLVALALYGAGSLWASAGSGSRAAAKEYEYPEISMSASQTTVPVGHPVTITWSTTNVDTCTAFGEWSGDKPLAGSEVVQPWGWDNSFFALDCTGIWGETGDGVFVDVVSPPTPRAVADQQQVYVDDYTQAAGLAQTFTVGTSGFLTDVSIAGTGAYSYDRLAITRVTSDGAPDPTHVLWSTTVLNQATSGSLHLPKPLLVFPGQRYALVLTAPGTAKDDTVAGEYVCSEGTPRPYARGDMYLQNEVGGSWTQQEGCDMVFSTYVLQRFKSSP